MEQLEKIKALLASMETDVRKFYEKKNGAAGTRVRKSLQEVKRTCNAMRNEVQDIRMERKTMKPE